VRVTAESGASCSSAATKAESVDCATEPDDTAGADVIGDRVVSTCQRRDLSSEVLQIHHQVPDLGGR